MLNFTNVSCNKSNSENTEKFYVKHTTMKIFTT